MALLVILLSVVRTISPFALKLETWLRMNGIKYVVIITYCNRHRHQSFFPRYENIFSMKFSSKGQIPFIELNGEEIPDSNIIIRR